jgi:hypothetical protein
MTPPINSNQLISVSPNPSFALDNWRRSCFWLSALTAQDIPSTDGFVIAKPNRSPTGGSKRHLRPSSRILAVDLYRVATAGGCEIGDAQPVERIRDLTLATGKAVSLDRRK